MYKKILNLTFDLYLGLLETLPRTLYIMCPMQLQSLKVHVTELLPCVRQFCD